MACREGDITKDAIFHGAVSVRQRRHGYRFSIDALLLAWYASALPGKKALELGTGSGVISLALAHNRSELRIDAVEIQPTLADLAQTNVHENGLANVTIHEADLRRLRGEKWEGRFDFVFANPPYRAVGRGRLNPEREKAVARHELEATLADVLGCALRCILPNGKIALVLLAERENDLRSLTPKFDLDIIQRTAVQPYPDRPENLLLLLLGSGEEKLSAFEMSVWEEVGSYTELVDNILTGSWMDLPHPLSDSN